MELWDPTTNRSIAQPEKDAPASLPHFSPDGSHLVYLTPTGTVVGYNVAARKEVCRIPRVLTEEAALAVALINGGKTIVAASPKKGDPRQTVLTLYEAATGKALEGAPIELPARVLLLHAAGNYLIAQADDRLLVCDANGKVLFPLMPRDSKQISLIAVSSDGQKVSARVSDRRLVTWATRTGKVVSEWDLPEGVHYFLYLKDSPYLLMSNNGEAFKFLGTHDGKIYTYNLRPLQITAHMDLSPSGDKLFLGGAAQPRVMATAPMLRVLPVTPAVPSKPVPPEPPTGEVAAIKLPEKGFVTNLAVASDGKTVALALRGGMLKLWDFENRRDPHTMPWFEFKLRDTRFRVETPTHLVHQLFYLPLNIMNLKTPNFMIRLTTLPLG
jgi:WD40 repeat protein